MKIIYECELPADNYNNELLKQADKMYCVLYDFKEMLINTLKYDNKLTPEEKQAIENIKQIYLNMINTRQVNLNMINIG